MRNPVRAFSLIEVLVVVSIVSVLGALLLPVTLSAVREARATSSLSNLRQNYVALALYRSEQDGDTKYGVPAEMGLPQFEHLRVLYLDPRGAIRPEWRSPCGTHPDYGAAVGYFYLLPAYKEVELAQRALRYRENLLLLSDVNCNDRGVALYAPERSKLGLGALLSGTLVRHRKPGLPTEDQDWWAPPSG